MPEPVPEASGLIMKSGNKTFIIGLHFSDTSKDTLEDKMKKLIRKDVEDGNF
ncbi:MAG: transposon-encoded TnpW family protein [Oscillospiraceae bacterium]|nr:transposon-encoded TnpW family protein [Oscillospiraceae bacterium]